MSIDDWNPAPLKSAIPPTWKAKDERKCICDLDPTTATVKERMGVRGHLNEANGFCCQHHGNTCGYCKQYN